MVCHSSLENDTDHFGYRYHHGSRPYSRIRQSCAAPLHGASWPSVCPRIIAAAPHTPADFIFFPCTRMAKLLYLRFHVWHALCPLLAMRARLRETLPLAYKALCAPQHSRSLSSSASAPCASWTGLVQTLASASHRARPLFLYTEACPCLPVATPHETAEGNRQSRGKADRPCCWSAALVYPVRPGRCTHPAPLCMPPPPTPALSKSASLTLARRGTCRWAGCCPGEGPPTGAWGAPPPMPSQTRQRRSRSW